MKAKKKYAEKHVGITPKEIETFEHRHKKVIEIFSNYNFDRILDIGCGDGNFSVLLKEASNAKEIYGIEMSNRGVELANKNGIKVFQLDVDEDDFPFEDDYFDAIFAGEVIEHSFDPDHFLDEVHRTLRVGGLCVITTPNLASIYDRIALLFGYQPFPMSVSIKHNIGRLYEPNEAHSQSLDHIRVFTLRSLKTVLKMHGFTIISVKGSCAKLPENMRFSRLVSVVDRAISLFPSLSYRVILECGKE